MVRSANCRVWEPPIRHPRDALADRVEDYVCQAVRKHQVQLAPAQKAMAADWTTAVQALGLPPIPANYKGCPAGPR